MTCASGCASGYLSLPPWCSALIVALALAACNQTANVGASSQPLETRAASSLPFTQVHVDAACQMLGKSGGFSGNARCPSLAKIEALARAIQRNPTFAEFQRNYAGAHRLTHPSFSVVYSIVRVWLSGTVSSEVAAKELQVLIAAERPSAPSWGLGGDSPLALTSRGPLEGTEEQTELAVAVPVLVAALGLMTLCLGDATDYGRQSESPVIAKCGLGLAALLAGWVLPGGGP